VLEDNSPNTESEWNNVMMSWFNTSYI
jgi:hypothetical protein